MFREDNSVLYDLIHSRYGVGCIPVAPPSDSRHPSAEETAESPIEATLLEALWACEDTRRVITQYPIPDLQGRLLSRADFAFPDAK